MLITAQHVEGPDGKQGINAFLYSHVRARQPIDWGTVDPQAIVDEGDGVLLSSLPQIHPGGNSVHSYLDGIGPDQAIDDGTLKKSLVELLGAPFPPSETRAVGGLRFTFATSPKYRSRADKELPTLVQQALALLELPKTVPFVPGSPLIVWVTQERTQRKFALDPAAAQLLKARGFVDRVPARVTVGTDVETDIARMVGDLFWQLTPIVTGLQFEMLSDLGGVEFKDSATKHLLWRWPPTADHAGYCLRCHEHGTLVTRPGGFHCESCGNDQSSDGVSR